MQVPEVARVYECIHIRLVSPCIPSNVGNHFMPVLACTKGIQKNCMSEQRFEPMLAYANSILSVVP